MSSLGAFYLSRSQIARISARLKRHCADFIPAYFSPGIVPSLISLFTLERENPRNAQSSLRFITSPDNLAATRALMRCGGVEILIVGKLSRLSFIDPLSD